jgi:hypothetical protein
MSKKLTLYRLEPKNRMQIIGGGSECRGQNHVRQNQKPEPSSKTLDLYREQPEEREHIRDHAKARHRGRTVTDVQIMGTSDALYSTADGRRSYYFGNKKEPSCSYRV